MQSVKKMGLGQIFIFYPMLIKFCMNIFYLNVGWKIEWIIEKKNFQIGAPLLGKIYNIVSYFYEISSAISLF